jgi:L-alanine-DL-glutamate epimerase-like enolase superfamily enzyme
MSHEIARVEAKALEVETDFAEFGIDRTRVTSICFVEVETREGLRGHGITYLADASVVARIINAVAGPAIRDMNAQENERIWQTLYWGLTSAAQSGFACHAMSAIDLALWDIKGKTAGMPVWRLLGGARDRLEVYATLGVPFLALDELIEMARRVIARGFKAIKIQVGRPGLDQRNGQYDLNDIVLEDTRRVAAIRDTVGDGIEIAIDGSCRFDLAHAVALAERVKTLGVGWYEEPVLENDVRLMADLRKRTSIAVSAGQNEGRAYRFRDMLLHKAVDVIQPNVTVAGGITQCAKIAGLAAAFNTPIASGGGGCPYHNMHVQAGSANGTKLEYQTSSAKACEALFKGYPRIEKGTLMLPETPGLGFDPDFDSIAECEI